MNAILIKLFATALTLSQVTTRPDDVKTQFDPAADGPQVVQILRDGCAHMRKAFDIEDINLDELISTAMEDPTSVAGDSAPKFLHGLDFGELNTSYKQFCKNENPTNSPFDAKAVIDFYNNAARNLPAAESLRDLKLPGASTILDSAGNTYSETFEANGRRRVVAIGEVPDLVQKAFVAAEDKRFFQHHGIDERGVIRAFIDNIASPGRPAGGSTITQQVVKNLSVGDDVTYERKIREMIVAARLEKILTKPQILGLYLNGIYLGRGAYGIEMAAQSYFGKPVGKLDVSEAALLAGLPKGPNFYSPDKFPERARERRAYVITRMKEDGAITEEQANLAFKSGLGLKPSETARRDSGFYFVEHVARESRTLGGLDSLTSASYIVRSTVNAGLQKATEGALQEGLSTYERATRRASFDGPEMNLSETVTKFEASPEPAPPPAPSPAANEEPIGKKSARKPAPKPTGPKPAWQRALESARPILYDVSWPLAVVLSTGKGPVKVGLADGRVASLDPDIARGRLKLYDAVRVKLRDPQSRNPRADLRVRPAVQGAAIVLENRTGRILAMVGGFSYPVSQLNRVTQSVRQPGSTLKPLTYLAALNAGLQPNTLVMDAPITLPSITGGASWSPKNYDGGGSGPTTIRRGLEFSKNLVTAQLLKGGIAPNPATSLQRVCDIALEAQLYAECERYYPFVLGSQPIRMIDLAGFYAAIANEGARPSPHAVESVEKDGQAVYTRGAKAPVRIGSADSVAFYQLKTMLQGVTQHGTAAALSSVSRYVAGKTGTSENENDAWFAGFTNEISVVVWVGYDNADGTRRTLGGGQTGGKVAVPIARAIFQAAWANGVAKTALSPPTPEARPFIVDRPINPRSGELVAGGGFLEHFRRKDGQVADTQYALVPRETVLAMRPDIEDDYGNSSDGADVAGDYEGNMPGGRRGGYDLDPFSSEYDPAIRRRRPREDAFEFWPGRNRYGQANPSPFGADPERQPRPRRRDPDYPFDDDSDF